jgi:hypothetical protein
MNRPAQPREHDPEHLNEMGRFILPVVISEVKRAGEALEAPQQIWLPSAGTKIIASSSICQDTL